MFDPLSRPGAPIGSETWFSDDANAKKREGMDVAAHAFGEGMRTDRAKSELEASKNAYEARKRAAAAGGPSGFDRAVGTVGTIAGAASAAVGIAGLI